MNESSRVLATFCGDRVVIGNTPIFDADFYNGEDVSKIHLVNMNDLTVRTVEFPKPLEEEKKDEVVI